MTGVKPLCLHWIMTILVAACDVDSSAGTPAGFDASTHLPSLEALSIPSLRQREYGSDLKIEAVLDHTNNAKRKVASYLSDGHRIYTRIDIPTGPPPADGFPVILFVHGWVGREAAPDYSFEHDPGTAYGRMVEAWTEAGYLVVSPALRGHGTVNGIAAEGIEFLDAWDNGSYLSPMFYAIDVLNLLEGLSSLEDSLDTAINHDRINISGHSQGGDVVLAALAISGEGSTIRNPFAAGSISSGCFGPRFEQVEIYGPMATTLEAFMSGDGTWTGTATGAHGEWNPNFVFGYPPDWIGTVDTTSADWTWQADVWSTPTVADALQTKYSEMYDAVNSQVADISDAEFKVIIRDNGKAEVHHDPQIRDAMLRIGGFGFPEFLTEPLHLHHSDRDYYSIPGWNEDLVSRINATGGQASHFSYEGNNHSLLISNYHWFSQGEVVEGIEYMIERDLALFGGAPVPADPASLTSIGSLQRYAATVKNEFQPAYTREPLDGIKREVVSFEADDLKQYALVLTPPGDAPEQGWPVLLMSHGHHPNPPDYGRLEDGRSERPGNYYRGLPLAFAKQGYLVIVPDFRGHNDSEGGSIEPRKYESYWYARDAVAAFRAIGSLPGASTDQVFLWGHSMGGNVTLRTLLALGDEVRGATIWSSSADPVDTTASDLLSELRTPLNIHHSVDDPVTPISWSRSVYEALDGTGRRVNFHTYPGEYHLFNTETVAEAVRTDVEFFSSLYPNAADN